ncbi:BTAD domain-containing putative transcriptional regulator [Streptomyces sp. ODS05-4]|uniref:BTAD domain-containing putative transcriptional regulator n=1 Tax=Streptomyces sp. ODS05-4 TaxID=2944939 RepID=UPI00272E0752|nr:BTAD domain-containing putative transcriptional regulator [Streptomyces sp. ODS05-4]
MEFLVLGSLEVRRSGEPVRIRGMRQHRLLALLLLHRGAVVTVNRLVDELWDDPPASARPQVHNAVRDLRRTLAAADGVSLDTTDAGYRLVAPADAVDAGRFTRQAHAARAAAREGRTGDAIGLLQAGVDLWRGEAFAGIDCPEVASAAVRLAEQRMTAIEELMSLRLRAGETSSLVGELHALVARHPLRDELRACLMLALFRGGRQADALAVHDEGRRLLAEEMGLLPSRRLQDLRAEILADTPAARGPAGGAGAAGLAGFSGAAGGVAGSGGQIGVTAAGGTAGLADSGDQTGAAVSHGAAGLADSGGTADLTVSGGQTAGATGPAGSGGTAGVTAAGGTASPTGSGGSGGLAACCDTAGPTGCGGTGGVTGSGGQAGGTAGLAGSGGPADPTASSGTADPAGSGDAAASGGRGPDDQGRDSASPDNAGSDAGPDDAGPDNAGPASPSSSGPGSGAHGPDAHDPRSADPGAHDPHSHAPDTHGPDTYDPRSADPGSAGTDAAAADAAGADAAGVCAGGGRAPVAVSGAAERGNFLPHGLADFTGRSGELRTLREAAAGQRSDTPLMIAVDGMGGVGKTSLAVRLAHQLTARYPDGQFFVNLHGCSARRPPLGAGQALALLLQASGVAARDVPDTLAERSALWRSRLAGRRCLVVLDDAADTAQVTPLLPGAGPALVLVTSRRRLSALDGARPLWLDALPPADAVELFTRVAGEERTAGQASQVARVVELCDRLPLAVRMAAARLRDRRTWTAADLADRLESASQRARCLRTADRDLMAVLRASYRHLDAAQRRFSRLICRQPASSYDVEHAAALSGLPAGDVECLFDVLVEHNLVREDAPARFSFPSLVRDCTRELAADEAA